MHELDKIKTKKNRFIMSSLLTRDNFRLTFDKPYAPTKITVQELDENNKYSRTKVGKTEDYSLGDFVRTFFRVNQKKSRQIADAWLRLVTLHEGDDSIEKFCKAYGEIFKSSRATPCIVIKTFNRHGERQVYYAHELLEKFIDDDLNVEFTEQHGEWNHYLFSLAKRIVYDGKIHSHVKKMYINEFDRWWRKQSYYVKLSLLLAFLAFNKDWVKKHINDDYHIFMSQHPLTNSGTTLKSNNNLVTYIPFTHRMESVREVRTLVLDFDNTDGKKQYEELVLKYGFKPFMIVRTGGGVQYHFRIRDWMNKNKWKFEKPEKHKFNTPQEIPSILSANKKRFFNYFIQWNKNTINLFVSSASAHKCFHKYARQLVHGLRTLMSGIDVNVGKANQLFRVPGFVNPKHNRKAFVMYIDENMKMYEFGGKKCELFGLIANDLKRLEQRREEKKLVKKFKKTFKRKTLDFRSIAKLRKHIRKLSNTDAKEIRILNHDTKHEFVQVIYKKAKGFVGTSLFRKYFRKYKVANGFRNKVTYALALLLKQEGYDHEDAFEFIKKNIRYESAFPEEEIAKAVYSAYYHDKLFSPEEFASCLHFADYSSGKRVIIQPAEAEIYDAYINLKGKYYTRKKNSFRIYGEWSKRIKFLDALIKMLTSGKEYFLKKEIMKESGLGKHQIESVMEFFRELGFIAREYIRQLRTSVYKLKICSPESTSNALNKLFATSRTEQKWIRKLLIKTVDNWVEECRKMRILPWFRKAKSDALREHHDYYYDIEDTIVVSTVAQKHSQI